MAYTGPKKFSKKVKTKSGRTKTVRYGAKGYSISPNQERRQLLCPVIGQMKKSPKAAKNPNSPLRLSRKKGGAAAQNHGEADANVKARYPYTKPERRKRSR